MRKRKPRRYVHSKRHTTERVRAMMNRTQPAVLVLPFTANHIAALGLAREEIDRGK